MNKTALHGDFPKQLTEFFDPAKSTYIAVANGDKEFDLLTKHAAETTNQSFRLRDAVPEKKQGLCDSKQNTRHTELICGLGLHTVTHDGHEMKLLIQSHGEPVGSSCGVSIYETATLFYPNQTGKQEILWSFVEHLIELSQKRKEGKVRIYSFHMKYQYWKNGGSRLKRPMSSLILQEDKKKQIVSDISDFLSDDSAGWYAAHGIPYKRSYMFHGPPGSGKSSLIHALCSEFDRNICFLQPCHELMTDDVFKEALQKCPSNSVIVLEDIDSLFTAGREKLNRTCPLTFSGFLNGIDGFGSPEGQMFMMTTNYLDRLDGALTRAGRVDLKVELGSASREQIKSMFLGFYPGHTGPADIFAGNVFAATNISMASLQNHFIRHRCCDAQTAATNIDLEELLGISEAERIKDEEKTKKEDEEDEKKDETEGSVEETQKGGEGKLVEWVKEFAQHIRKLNEVYTAEAGGSDSEEE